MPDGVSGDRETARAPRAPRDAAVPPSGKRAPAHAAFPYRAFSREVVKLPQLPDPATISFTRPDGLVGRYISLCEHCTDAPWAYHEASFWTVLGTAFGRSVQGRMGPDEIFTNLYTCLVGQSSKARKSTCVGLAKRLAAGLDVPVLPAEVTPEKMWDILSERPRGILISPEFSGFLALAKKSYGAGLIELLLELYDSPDRLARQTKKDGETSISNPFVAILSASTISLLKYAFAQSDMSGGFVPRFLLVCRTKDRRPMMQVQPDLQIDRMRRLTKHIKIALLWAEKDGETKIMRLSGSAREEYAASCELIDAFCVMYLPGGGVRQAERLKRMVLKIGVTSAALRMRTLMIERDVHMGLGVVLRVISAHANMCKIFVLDTQWPLLVAKVQEIIETAKTIQRSKLLKMLVHSLSTKRLDIILASLEEAGLIKVHKGKSVGRGRPPETLAWVADRPWED